MATIVLEADAPPIVRILGVTLRRAAASPSLASTIESMNGSVALKSTTDPQAATVTFDKGTVTIKHGVDPEADMTISADLTTMGRPGAPKPKVSGAARHPKFALGVSKVLEPPVDGGWQGAAREFWAWAHGRRGCPPAVVVTSATDGGSVTLGQPADGESPVELRGEDWVLEAVFTGGDNLGSAVLEHRLQVAANLRDMSWLIGLSVDWMLGNE